jgi:hypothetical protein
MAEQGFQSVVRGTFALYYIRISMGLPRTGYVILHEFSNFLCQTNGNFGLSSGSCSIGGFGKSDAEAWILLRREVSEKAVPWLVRDLFNDAVPELLRIK